MTKGTESLSKNIAIALPPSDDIDNKMIAENDENNTTIADSSSRMDPEDSGLSKKIKKPKNNNFKFADKIIVDGKEILEIDYDKVFYEEESRVKRKTRWADPEIKRKVETTDLNLSNEIKLMIGDDPNKRNLLAIGFEGSMGNIEKKDEPHIRPTKWGESWERTFRPPPFPGIARGVSGEDLEYLMRLYRLDELTKKKNLG